MVESQGREKKEEVLVGFCQGAQVLCGLHEHGVLDVVLPQQILVRAPRIARLEHQEVFDVWSPDLETRKSLIRTNKGTREWGKEKMTSRIVWLWFAVRSQV